MHAGEGDTASVGYAKLGLSILTALPICIIVLQPQTIEVEPTLAKTGRAMTCKVEEHKTPRSLPK